MYLGGMSSPIPVGAIKAGSHVLLDIQHCKIRLARAMPDNSVLVEEYKIRSVDDALDFYAYLQINLNRFSSIKVV